MFLDGVGLLTTPGVGLFVRLRMSNWIIIYITLLSWEFLLKWCNFFWSFVETEISCCAPWFPFILTAKFHSLYVEESESGIFERWSRKFWKDRNRRWIFYLRLRNPAWSKQSVADVCKNWKNRELTVRVHSLTADAMYKAAISLMMDSMVLSGAKAASAQQSFHGFVFNFLSSLLVVPVRSSYRLCLCV